MLKIFPSDSAYVKFVEFVQSHSGNPHLPRFSRYVRPVPGTEFSYVRMEKLQKVTLPQLLNKYAAYLAEMVGIGQVMDMQILDNDIEDLLDNQLQGYGI